MSEARCHVRLRSDAVVYAQISGRADGSSVAEVHRQMAPLLAQGGGIFLFDLAMVSGFDAISLPGPARAMLTALKDHDYVIVAAVTNGLVRMMGVSLCAAAQVKLEMFPSITQAEQRARELAAQGTPSRA